MKRLIASTTYKLNINFEILKEDIISTAKDWFSIGFISQYKLEDLYNNSSLPVISDADIEVANIENNAEILKDWQNNDNFINAACRGVFTEVIKEMDNLDNATIILYMKDGKPHAEEFAPYFKEYCNNITAIFPKIQQDLQKFNYDMQLKDKDDQSQNLELYVAQFLDRHNYPMIIQDSNVSDKFNKIFSLK